MLWIALILFLLTAFFTYGSILYDRATRLFNQAAEEFRHGSWKEGKRLQAEAIEASKRAERWDPNVIFGPKRRR